LNAHKRRNLLLSVMVHITYKGEEQNKMQSWLLVWPHVTRWCPQFCPCVQLRGVPWAQKCSILLRINSPPFTLCCRSTQKYFKTAPYKIIQRVKVSWLCGPRSWSALTYHSFRTLVTVKNLKKRRFSSLEHHTNTLIGSGTWSSTPLRAMCESIVINWPCSPMLWNVTIYQWISYYAHSRISWNVLLMAQGNCSSYIDNFPQTLIVETHDTITNN
jgi:hypothetical protein